VTLGKRKKKRGTWSNKERPGTSHTPNSTPWEEGRGRERRGGGADQSAPYEIKKKTVAHPLRTAAWTSCAALLRCSICGYDNPNWLAWADPHYTRRICNTQACTHHVCQVRNGCHPTLHINDTQWHILLLLHCAIAKGGYLVHKAPKIKSNPGIHAFARE
jgi:hypothetical protein